jgi:hypothetical protein
MVRYWLYIALGGGLAGGCAKAGDAGNPPDATDATIAASPQRLAVDTLSPKRAPGPRGKVAIVVGPTSIWLDATPMQTAVRALGSEAIARVSEGFALLACFETKTPNRAYLTLEAHESDTAPVITAEISRSSPINNVLKSCAPLDLPEGMLRNNLGVRLGMSRSEVEQLLGPPKSSGGMVAQYALTTMPAARPTAPGDQSYSPKVLLALTFEADVLVGMNISQGNEILSGNP